MHSVLLSQAGMTYYWLILTVRKSEGEDLKRQENKNVQLGESKTTD